MEQILKNLNKYLMMPKELLVVAAVISIIGIIIIPLHTAILDFFLIISFAISFMVILISVYIKNPTSLTMFPTLILIVTLFRLALNVATTRSILGEGHNGPESVSNIITAFGDFVVGGNFVIGVIIFIILVVINFMVITKGSTRVAEVSARFTLDAMPGKQMSIDAALNSGSIDDKEAQRMRGALIQEANFYGSMDGSSKFVRGDAVAGIIITAVNIIAGFLIGVFQHGMDATVSGKTYTLLTIGDGLVSQIPALLLSTATGILITKSTMDNLSFASGVTKQMSEDYQTFFIVGALMWLFTLIPGFPSIALMIVGTIFLVASFSIYRVAKRQGFVIFDTILELARNNEFFKRIGETMDEIREENIETQTMNSVDDSSVEIAEPVQIEEERLVNTNVLELVFGYQIAGLANEGPLLEKLKGIKKSIVEETGFVIPQIKVRDDSSLAPNEYVFKLKGIEVFSNKVPVNKLLAIPGFGSDELEGGVPVKEPIYNMDAYWINMEDKEEALMSLYTVIDIPSLIVTHVMEEIKKETYEIITRQDVVELLNKVKETHPVIVEDALRNASYGLVLQVFKQLLKEKVPINDLVTILEEIADMTEHVKSPTIIVESLRSKLYRVITNVFKSKKDGIMHIFAIDGATEVYLQKKMSEVNGHPRLMMEIKDIQEMFAKVTEEVNKLNDRGIYPYTLVVDPLLRRPLYDVFNQLNMPISILAHSELDPKVPFNIEANISLEAATKIDNI